MFILKVNKTLKYGIGGFFYMVKQRIIYIVLTILILITVSNYENNITDGGKKLFTTFNEINFDMIESDVNIWGEYSKSYMSEKEMKELAERVAENLQLETTYETIYDEEELQRTYTIQKDSTEATTVIKVVELIEEVENNGLKVINYLIVNLKVVNKCDSILFYREKINKIFDDLGVEPSDSITLTSRHNGKLEEAEAKRIMNTVLRNMKGTIKDKYEATNIYSIYAYSDYIPEHILTNGKKINVDLAMTYNELEDVTYLYAAIPVITIDY